MTKVVTNSNRGSKKGERRGGRRKGTPNKINADLRSMIMGALSDAGGRAYLKRQASENPGAFLTLVGKTLPKDIQLAGPGGESLGPIQFKVNFVTPQTRE